MANHRRRVENSWGRANADSGYYVMTKDWFDEWCEAMRKETGEDLQS